MAELTGAPALIMQADDHVAMAAVDLAAGTVVEVAGRRVVLRQNIPFGHKFAIRPVRAGELVLKYGQPIGRATADIALGDHVHVHNVESLRGRGDLGQEAGDVARQASKQAHASTVSVRHAPPLVSHHPATTFLGYRRPAGRVGVRNHVLVLASVLCANGLVERLGRELPDVVALPHAWGCSQIGADQAQSQRVLEEFAAHPNVGAVLLVGLGCETMPTAEMAEKLASQGVNVRRVTIQDEGGNRAALAKSLAVARELLAATAGARREPVPISELIVGVECGGSDAWSGVTANPATGAASDLVVQAGGTAMLSEVPEFIGAEHLLAARAADPQIGAQIVAAANRYEVEAQRMGADLRGAQPSPGNIAGGLTTIEEKSLGAIAKGGTTTVQEFLPYAYRPTRRGLVVMDTPGNDPESVTGMVAGGAQIVVFTTGRGTPVGCPIAPVIKVASNTAMYRRLQDDMDVDAGAMLGGEPLAAAGQRIFQEILAVSNGKETASEIWGARDFAINVIGPRL